MDNSHKHEYHIREVPTRSVTLFPSCAQVVRDIKHVPLKSGTNEVTIVGLTPTMDEDTIKVEGTGTATITDISYELLPNRDIFQEIYPDSEDEDEDESESDDDDPNDVRALDFDGFLEKLHEDGPELRVVREKLQSLRDDREAARETRSSAETRVKLLNDFGNSIVQVGYKHPVDIAASLDNYRQEREKAFVDHTNGTRRERELAKQIQELVKKERELAREQAREERKARKAKKKEKKAQDKARKAAEKERQIKARRAEDRREEKARTRKEREKFWPRFVYTVRVTLEVLTSSPAFSRRSSMASDVELVKESVETPEGSTAQGTGFTCDLSLSYMTSSAFWSPHYDFALSTTSNTGMLYFDAQLTNMTSETWSNCKLTLSASQASFSSLDDKLPTLAPWRIKLGGMYFGVLSEDHAFSREEQRAKASWDNAHASRRMQKARGNLFGVDEAPSGNRGLPNQVKPASAPAFAPSNSAQFGQSSGVVGHSSSQPTGSALFASNKVTAPVPAPQQPSQNNEHSLALQDHRFPLMLLEQQNKERLLMARQEEQWGTSNADDAATMLEPVPELAFQESVIEETGLTTNYDMAGTKTLVPRGRASKQRIAKVGFTNVVFSHTVVPKLKPVAYLKASLRNTSKMTLIKGSTGLTLDGTFLGRTTLPRCSAGGIFILWLGVDPAMRVVYPKPDIRRSTTGVFSKEYNSAYKRSITLANTRAASGKPAAITVLDQVPVSEDERLRVTVTNPKGLVRDGASVKVDATGSQAHAQSSGKEKSKEDDTWGRATVALKKAGTMAWDVSLNPGKSVKLMLEYELGLPQGEDIMQV